MGVVHETSNPRISYGQRFICPASILLQLISLLTSSRGPRILLFRTRISLDPVMNNKEITIEGLKNQLFRSKNSLEAISLEAESTVCGFEAGQWTQRGQCPVEHRGEFPSVCPSVRPSVHPSVCPSVHPFIRPEAVMDAVYTMASVLCDWAGAVMWKPIVKCQKSKCGTNWVTNQTTNGPTDRLTDWPQQGQKPALVTEVGQYGEQRTSKQTWRSPSVS